MPDRGVSELWVWVAAFGGLIVGVVAVLAAMVGL